jgi:DNA processing protein
VLRLGRVDFPVHELRGATYPPRLRDLPDASDTIWVTGELPRGPAAAIVGTRRPSEDGRQFARAIARELAEAGVAVFSGGALGIDTAAHEGALDGGGPTVVVAPSSFDCPYPPENQRLFERIVRAGGAFVTGYPPGTSARQHHFFPRNAQLAALTSVLVVVETRYIGGARNAAAAARKLGRPVLAVPGAPWVPQAAGCILEIRNGARIAASVDDVLAVLDHPKPRQGGSPPPSAGPPPSPSGSSAGPDGDAVLAALRKGPAYPDALCAATGLRASQIQALLLTLTLEGTLVSEPSGRVSLVRY